MFSFNSASITRGYGYKLFGKISRVNIRHQFFCNRVVSVWKTLPATDFNFKSFRALTVFKAFLLNIDLPAYLRRLNEATIRAMRLGASQNRSELFYLSLYVPCYILSLVGIGFLVV